MFLTETDYFPHLATMYLQRAVILSLRLHFISLNKPSSFSLLSYLRSLGHLSSSSLRSFQFAVTFLDHDQTRP